MNSGKIVVITRGLLGDYWGIRGLLGDGAWGGMVGLQVLAKPPQILGPYRGGGAGLGDASGTPNTLSALNETL